MTAVLSTSGPIASVALFDSGGSLLASGREEAPMGAGGASLRILEALLRENGSKLEDVKVFAADTGPGSFTGVKVAVTLAKTLAFAIGAKCAGVLSFDLIGGGVVVVPSRKGEWFVSTFPERVSELPPAPYVGYGPGIENPLYPDASRARIHDLKPIAPEALLPTYFAEPSISTPKKPYPTAAEGAAGQHLRG